MKEVNKHTGDLYELDFDITNQYGDCWYEAHIPLKDKKGNKYLLTWKNCD